MCPFCLAAMGLIVAGAASTGGLAALAVKVSRKKTEQEKSSQTQIKGETKMSTSMIENPKIVSRDEWLAARKKLLAKEKRLTRERDALAANRRQLPWVKVEKNYVFDSPGGKKIPADLFDSRNQLIVYHFMFGPEWNEGWPNVRAVHDMKV